VVFTHSSSKVLQPLVSWQTIVFFSLNLSEHSISSEVKKMAQKVKSSQSSSNIVTNFLMLRNIVAILARRSSLRY
jgi:hypothetical protein